MIDAFMKWWKGKVIPPKRFEPYCLSGTDTVAMYEKAVTWTHSIEIKRGTVNGIWIDGVEVEDFVSDITVQPECIASLTCYKLKGAE